MCSVGGSARLCSRLLSRIPAHTATRQASSYEALAARLGQMPNFTDDKLLCGSGQTNMDTRVRQALTWPTRGHMSPLFWQIMDDVKEGLRYLLQTENNLTLAVTGAGHSAMEAAFYNLVEPGDSVVVLENGYWGVRGMQTAQCAGARAHKVSVPLGQTFSLERIEQALKEHKPKALFVAHGESSTGALQDLQGVGWSPSYKGEHFMPVTAHQNFCALCHAHDCLVVVDALATVGDTTFCMDDWHIDCAFAGSQKALGSAAGIAPISFNDRCWHKIQTRQVPMNSLMLDMRPVANYWGCDDKPRQYHHTEPTQLVYAMKVALSILVDEGLENVIKRHENNTRTFNEGLNKIGLELFIKDESKRMNGVSTICVPDGIELRPVIDRMWAKLVRSTSCFRHDIEIWGGYGELAGKIWRIGMLGPNRPEVVQRVLAALEECLQHFRK